MDEMATPVPIPVTNSDTSSPLISLVGTSNNTSTNKSSSHQTVEGGDATLPADAEPPNPNPSHTPPRLPEVVYTVAPVQHVVPATPHQEHSTPLPREEDVSISPMSASAITAPRGSPAPPPIRLPAACEQTVEELEEERRRLTEVLLPPLRRSTAEEARAIAALREDLHLRQSDVEAATARDAAVREAQLETVRALREKKHQYERFHRTVVVPYRTRLAATIEQVRAERGKVQQSVEALHRSRGALHRRITTEERYLEKMSHTIDGDTNTLQELTDRKQVTRSTLESLRQRKTDLQALLESYPGLYPELASALTVDLAADNDSFLSPTTRNHSNLSSTLPRMNSEEDVVTLLKSFAGGGRSATQHPTAVVTTNDNAAGDALQQHIFRLQSRLNELLDVRQQVDEILMAKEQAHALGQLAAAWGRGGVSWG
ncbi:hypothetical protein ADEAN_000358200 [Angomonas deanei]|uniref:Uncharacterized protein n=1 Tax=Angomonas deanei TaxID=59799 RepID=A0A7G2CAM2_9TRYP|nr:hypothetical protein ADEAN_000358200 [Angomonas deanei]